MAGRHGAVPKLLRADSVHSEAEEIGRELQNAHDSGTPWKDMAVLFPAHFVGDAVATVLHKAKIPYERLEKNSASRKYKAGEDSVKIMTMHASKGLEFPVVAIAGLGFMPYRPDRSADDARLLYVAMTRATETLVMTASRKSAFVERLIEVWHAA
jgi:superfamily I DNA/RNA helicase